MWVVWCWGLNNSVLNITCEGCSWVPSRDHFVHCATFPIDRGPDLGWKWPGLCRLPHIVARRYTVIMTDFFFSTVPAACVILIDITSLLLTLRDDVNNVTSSLIGWTRTQNDPWPSPVISSVGLYVVKKGKQYTNFLCVFKFIEFLRIEMWQVVVILPHRRQVPASMAWW